MQSDPSSILTTGHMWRRPDRPNRRCCFSVTHATQGVGFEGRFGRAWGGGHLSGPSRPTAAGSPAAQPALRMTGKPAPSPFTYSDSVRAADYPRCAVVVPVLAGWVMLPFEPHLLARVEGTVSVGLDVHEVHEGPGTSCEVNTPQPSSSLHHLTVPVVTLGSLRHEADYAARDDQAADRRMRC